MIAAMGDGPRNGEFLARTNRSTERLPKNSIPVMIELIKIRAEAFVAWSAENPPPAGRG
jgi:hypothetical protein